MNTRYPQASKGRTKVVALFRWICIDEPLRMRGLARVFSARIHKVWTYVKDQSDCTDAQARLTALSSRRCDKYKNLTNCQWYLFPKYTKPSNAKLKLLSSLTVSPFIFILFNAKHSFVVIMVWFRLIKSSAQYTVHICGTWKDTFGVKMAVFLMHDYSNIGSNNDLMS